jgi:hypothetical protein
MNLNSPRAERGHAGKEYPKRCTKSTTIVMECEDFLKRRLSIDLGFARKQGKNQAKPKGMVVDAQKTEEEKTRQSDPNLAQNDLNLVHLVFT